MAAASRRTVAEVDLNPARIELDEENKTVLVTNLLVQEPEVYEYLAKAAPSEHTGLLVRALRVGAVALRDAVTASKVDYVQREFAALKQAFGENLTKHFGPKGDITTLIEDKFGEDGEVQTKLAAFLGEDGDFAKLLDKFLGEDGAVQTLLGEDGAFQERLEEYFGDDGILRKKLDETFGEKGGQVYELLSHKNEKGPVGAFMTELERMFDPDVEGSPLNQVRLEIRDQFKTLYKDFGEALGKAKEKTKGTGKGADFQDWVFDTLQEAAALTGDAVDEVGEQRGLTRKTGDVLVKLNEDETHGVETPVIFEAKNEPISLRGKDTIYHELERALLNRKAAFAVAVVHPDHSKDEVSPLVFRAPNMIVCVASEAQPLPLQVAYRLSRTLVLARQSSEEVGLDKETVNTVVTKVTAKLTEFQAIYRSITQSQKDLEGVKTALAGIADSITRELDVLVKRSA